MRKHFCSFISIGALLILNSCIIIPTPWTKDRFSEEVQKLFTPGVSNRDDVIEKLGTPDIIWETERIYVYTWKRLLAVMPWFVTGKAGGVVPIESDEALLVLFDDAGFVKRIGKDTKRPFESYDDFLRRLLKENNESPKDAGS